MKIDITTPQPCPVCGAEMKQHIYSDMKGRVVEYEDEWFCSDNYCGMANASLTLRELNHLSLLARLGEVAVWFCEITGHLKRDIYPGVTFMGEYADERRAVLAALEELEAQA